MAQVLYPLCAYCNGPITETVIKALGHTFHEDHFLCTHCKKPITDRAFNMHDNQPYCKDDYEKLFSKTCAACGQIIRDFVLTAGDKSYHKTCFVCTNCKRPLVEGYFEKHNNPYCRDCAVFLFSHKCKVCNEPIEGLVLNVMGGKYHPKCFRCDRCREPITGDTFQYDNNQAICMGCTRKQVLNQSQQEEVLSRSQHEDVLSRSQHEDVLSRSLDEDVLSGSDHKGKLNTK